MPLLFTHPSFDLAIWKIVETWQELFDLIQNKTLFAEDIQKIHSDTRKCEWIAVRLLVKHLVGSEIPVCYGENGAPFLKDHSYPISITHTKGYAAILLSIGPYPGLDIEYLSERAWNLRSKYLNIKELELFEAVQHAIPINKNVDTLTPDSQSGLPPYASKSQLATICWCAKETAFKALQATEVDFIEHLHIEPFILSETGELFLKETKTSKQETYRIHYQISDDYIITWKV